MAPDSAWFYNGFFFEAFPAVQGTRAMQSETSNSIQVVEWLDPGHCYIIEPIE
jgi:hypothetical protein